MGWLARSLIGVTTGLVTMALAFYVAYLATDWYNISSFEGESGYFVVLLALSGLVGGVVIGLISSSLLASRAKPGFVKALGISIAASCGIVLAIGGVARLQADVPPRINGEALLLAVELKWPGGQTLPAMAGGQVWSLRLNSSSGRTVRASVSGPLWLEDARLVENHWVVPGAVEVFTSRGDRSLDVLPTGTIEKGFGVPLPASPGPEYLEWSEWLPRAPEGQPPLPDGLRYRFKVVPRNQPIRTEVFGPFEVATVADGFLEITSQGATVAWTTYGTFRVRYRGQPVVVESVEEVNAVSALAGAVPALLVQTESADRTTNCHVLVVEPAQVRTERVGECSAGLHPAPLTSDAGVFAAARDSDPPAGRFDRTSFQRPGKYLFTGAVLDTETMTVRPFSAQGQSGLIVRIPPLGVSPDGESLVRLESDEVSDGKHALAVTVLGTSERYRLPIDKARMRYADMDQIDPAWVLHHFAWERAVGGGYRLAERQGFTPLPYRGTLTLDETGYREYRVAPAKAGLRAALIDFLVAEFQAERGLTEAGAYAHTVRIQGAAAVSVSFNESDAHVGVWMDRGTDSTLVATIAERFNAALATGRYDHLFES